MFTVTDDKWMTTRRCLGRTGDRFAELVSSAPDPASLATVHWSVVDTATHVVTLARGYGALVDPQSAAPFEGLDDLIEATIVDTVEDFNAALLGQFTERDPLRIAESLRADVDHLLKVTNDMDPAMAVPWLGGSEIPLAGMLAHLLNEFQIHGRDIARATGARWVVPPDEAALFLELFLVGVTHYGYGRLLDGHGPAPAGRVAVEFRSRYTAPVTMAMTDGFVTVEEPGGDTDVRLSFDPTTLNLMLFGRVGKARAVLTGKVVIRGRRPWKLPAFLRIVRLPS